MGCITAVVEGGAEPAAGPDPAVPWWSFGKTVLAAAALVLAGEGRLQLDRPVGSWPFTLRHLLQHRSGLPDYGRLDGYHRAVANGEEPWLRDVMLRRAWPGPLEFDPGQGWGYSNVGYMLVKEMIEAATGEECGAALSALVLRPLGLAGVWLARTAADLEATAWGNRSGYHPGWVYHGLLVGPVPEAAGLLHGLLRGRLLPAGVLAEMLTAHPVGGPVPGRPWQTGTYGLGLMVGLGGDGRTYIGHSGGGPGSTAAVYQTHPDRTAAAFAAEEDLGIVERCAFELAAG